MGTTLLDSGVYDALEVSRLLGLPVDCVVRWALPDRNGLPPIVPATHGRSFSFLDLVSLAIVGEVWKRNVRESDMRHGAAFLAAHYHQQHPLAHEDTVASLATSGTAWVADLDGGWWDLGKGGQGAFEEVIRLYLQRIVWDDGGVACRWQPATFVVLDPRVQAGAPCIGGTRVPTATVAAMAKVDPIEVIADDLDLSAEQTQAAVDFEESLLVGRGIAA